VSISLRMPLSARFALRAGLMTIMCFTAPPMAFADGGVVYDDIAAGDSAGVDYRRTPSARNAIWEVMRQQPTYTFEDLLNTPLKPRGAPGIALFDADGDGDLDVYVTNGPGSSNSLYANQLTEDGDGTVTFVDIGASSGAGLMDQDSTGVCAGDIDNDGDQDLYVLGSMEPNRLLENQGDGTFVDITMASGAGAGELESSSCTMADIDGDGLLDIFLGNTFDMTVQFAIFVEPFGFNQHNQLLQNQGDNVFADISEESGIWDTRGFDPVADGSPTITWGVIAIDYDGDGDMDLLHADDQAAVGVIGSVEPVRWDRGMIHVFENDGTGFFADVTEEVDMDRPGQWMSLSAGDVNCDGRLDVWGSNFGDYAALPIWPNMDQGGSTSRFFFGLDTGFADPNNTLVGDASVFGWGASMFDYDNDGDLDIAYHGGLDVGPWVDASNPGMILQNTGYCSARFVYDASAKSGTNHQRRTVHGLATGDLDNDGFDDIVTVSAFDFPEPIPVIPYGAQRGTPLDAAGFVPTFAPGPEPGVFVPTGINMPDGTLSVELSSGNDNHWVKVRTLGTVGLLDSGMVNRDGVGAVVRFKPKGNSREVARPVTAGSSYASTNSRTLTFGLGSANRGRLDVTWPGGVRNRLYGVKAGSVIHFPEIPCSYDGDWGSKWAYMNCVNSALTALVAEGVLTTAEHGWFAASALKAFRKAKKAAGDNDGDGDGDDDDGWKKKGKHPWYKHGKGLKGLPDPVSEAAFQQHSAAKVELGQALFFDKILSGNKNIACASCHHPVTGSGDGLALGAGEGARGMSVVRTLGAGDEAVDQRIPRNAQPLFNLGALEYTTFFHDGRVFPDATKPSGFESPSNWQLPDGLDSPLAAQAMFPVTSDDEMAGQYADGPIGFAAQWQVWAGPNGLWELLTQRLREIPEYVALFQAAYPDQVTSADDMTFVQVANALAAFQAWAFRFDASPFDRFLEGDWRAMSPAQIRGMNVFYGEAGCSSCHSGTFQTDHDFHAIAMPQIGPGKRTREGATDTADFGLFFTTGMPEDRYKFRTPALRNVALTAPYGHSGAYETLEAVVAHHLNPVDSLHNYDQSQVRLPSRPDLDPEDFLVMNDEDARNDIAAANELAPVYLSDQDFADLIDFLHALTDPAALDMRSIVPTSVPSGLPLLE